MHPTDGMWREVLDGESDPPVQRELENHLAACPDCQRTVTALRDQSWMVTGLFDHLDRAVPVRTLTGALNRSRRRSSRGLLAAAAIIICMVTAAGATVRTGLFHRAADWFLGPTPRESTSLTAPSLQADSSNRSGIAFESSGNIEVAFSHRQAAGEIAIVFGTGPRVSIIASTPVGYSIRKGRVAIANQGARADYRIVVPRNAGFISVRIAGTPVFVKQGSAVISQARADSAGSYLLPFSSEDKAHDAD